MTRILQSSLSFLLLLGCLLTTTLAFTSSRHDHLGRGTNFIQTSTTTTNSRLQQLPTIIISTTQLYATSKTTKSKKGGTSSKKAAAKPELTPKAPTTPPPMTASTTSTASTSTPSASSPASSTIPTLRKDAFVEMLDNELKMGKSQSQKVLNSVLMLIMQQVALGKKVNFPGFGHFQPKGRAARKGRNPQTGEPLDIPASVSPGFTAAKAWKDLVNNNNNNNNKNDEDINANEI